MGDRDWIDEMGEQVAAVRRAGKRETLRERAARLERERDELAAQLAALRAEVHDVLAEPHAYIGGRERSVLTCAVAAATAPAVEAQLAALREAADERETAREIFDNATMGDEPVWTRSMKRNSAAKAALTAALAATAPAVEAYTRRVQAEALESAADEIEARGEATRHPWMLGPSEHNPSGTVLTDAGAAKCDEARWLRARARELRGGR